MVRKVATHDVDSAYDYAIYLEEIVTDLVMPFQKRIGRQAAVHLILFSQKNHVSMIHPTSDVAILLCVFYSLFIIVTCS